MSRGRAIALAIIAFILVSAFANGNPRAVQPARADALHYVDTLNETNFPVWITVYAVGRSRQLDWGWVEPHQRRRWKSGNYFPMEPLDVRAEIHFYKADRQPKIDKSSSVIVCPQYGGEATVEERGYRGSVKSEQDFKDNAGAFNVVATTCLK